MTDEEPAMLAKILAEPEEDTHRVVYADWLDERGAPGDSERAEFIRVQIELSKLPPPNPWCRGCGWTHPECSCDDRSNRPRYYVLQDQAAALLRGPRPDMYENEPIWFNEGDGTANWVTCFRPTWERGFVAAVTCEAAQWFANGDAIRARYPVVRVQLVTWAYYLWHPPEGDEPGGYALLDDPLAKWYSVFDVGQRATDLGWDSRFPTQATTAGLLHLRWPGVAFEFLTGWH